jgi:hypothetical protein
LRDDSARNRDSAVERRRMHNGAGCNAQPLTLDTMA